MNAKNVYDTLTRAGYCSQIVSLYDYDIDRNRRFFVVRVANIDINRRLVSLLNDLHCIAVLGNVAVFQNGVPILSMCVDVYPKDMKSFDWEEEK